MSIFEELEKSGIQTEEKGSVAVTARKKSASRAKKAVGNTSETPIVEKKEYHTYEDFEYKDLLMYAGLDCIATSGVLAKLFPKLCEEQKYTYIGLDGSKTIGKAPAIIDSVSKVEMKAFDYILDLEINGMKYDCDKNAEISNCMIAEMAELEDTIRKRVGNINLNSSTEVQHVLYDVIGLKAPFETKGGDPSVDGEALLTLAGIDPMSFKYEAPDPNMQWLANMAKLKDIKAVHNTFIKSYVKDFVKRDGRIHPSYNLHGTSSFRITGSDPNLTQLPRPKHGYNIRECYTVEEGNIFICADWSSAEVKFLAAMCQDKAMLHAIQNKFDFHSFSASQMLGVPYEEFIAILKDDSSPLRKSYKQTRQSSKALTFGVLYGSSVNGIALNLGVSKDEAQRLIDMYFKAYPGVLRYIQSTHNMALANRYVLTPFGQRRMEYGAFPVFKYTAAYNASLRNSQNVR